MGSESQESDGYSTKNRNLSRESDSNGLRWYSDGDNEFMSVTTVLSFLDEDTSGLDYWKRNNQANGDDFHWNHIFWYSAPRGTLCHYHALNPLADEEMWGDEEQESLEQVIDGPQQPSAHECDIHSEYAADCYSCMDGAFNSDASYDKSDVVYSILKNKEVVDTRDQFSDLLDHTTLSDVALRDISWFTDTFGTPDSRSETTSESNTDSAEFETVSEVLGINSESVIAVERYLLDNQHKDSQESTQSSNAKIGYGGQCDLLYEDPSGNIVMADLKTSSGLRQKHVLQAVAYGAAVEHDSELPDTVDRHEVIRIHPDTKTYQVHTDVEPDHYPDGKNGQGDEQYTSDGWFEDDWGDYSYDSTDEMYDQFVDCIETAIEYAED